MDDVIYQRWEKKLRRYNLSDRQILNPCGDRSLSENAPPPDEIDFSGEYANEAHPSGKYPDELDPPESADGMELPGKYAAFMRHRVMLEERLRVVSPERTVEILRLYPPDKTGRPGIWAIDKRTSFGVNCVWRKGSRVHVGRQRSRISGKSSRRRKLEPDPLFSLTWGRKGRSCSALHPSDEDRYWFKYALDDRWIPKMHEIVSIASAGGDEREWQEKQFNHSRGDRTGLGHSLDKINRPMWTRKPETLAFALNQRFPGLKPEQKPPHGFSCLAEAMEVIWKRGGTSHSESQRALMRKLLERFRHFGLSLSKDASCLLTGIEELLRGDLFDFQGDPVKIGLVFLWQQAGFLSERDLSQFIKSRAQINKSFSDLSELGADIRQRILALENGASCSFLYQMQLQADSREWEYRVRQRRDAHNQLLDETLDKARLNDSAPQNMPQIHAALSALNAIFFLFSS
jgi:hypothetical protein